MEQRLASIGLHVLSPHWLSSCQEHLQNENLNPTDEDEILYQILNTDLRNVIRCWNRQEENSADSGLSSSMFPSKMLRNAIETSKVMQYRENDNNNHHATSSAANLPESFRLMVQIEELLDVSLNAEDRLSLGPASLSSPTPVGNQKQRCLKMLLSDGYFDNGECSSHNRSVLPVSGGTSSGGVIPFIVAMETEPIPDLSVHSKPGIKAILSGPMEVRCGILMLNPGNTTVLGGCVPDLIPIQKKAMDMAAKLSGVGIDPTFRALVWNPEAGMEEEEQDEGEGESRDVPEDRGVMTTRAATAMTGTTTATTAMTATATMTTVSTQPSRQSLPLATQPPAPPQPTLLHSSRDDTSRSMFDPCDGHHQDVEMEDLVRGRPMSRGIGELGKASSSGSIVSNPYQQQQQQQRKSWGVPSEQNMIGESSTTANGTITTATAALHLNASSPSPWRAPNTSFTSPAETRIGNTDNANTHRLRQSLDNPYKRHDQDGSESCNVIQMDMTPPDQQLDEVALPSGPSPLPPTTHHHHHQQQQQQQVPVAPSLQTPQTPPPPPTTTTTTTTTTAIRSNWNPSMPYSHDSESMTPKTASLDKRLQQHLSPTALSEPMSFSELKTLLDRIIKNHEEYIQYEGKIFIVSCKYAPPHKKCKKFKGLDIQKQKDYKKRGVEKYEFAMTCQMMGNNDPTEKITVRITHSVLKQYFGLSAAELRTMLRENKEQANKIANEGGTSVLSDLKTLSTCHMRLIHSSDDFFKDHAATKESDGEDPLLEIFKREDLIM